MQHLLRAQTIVIDDQVIELDLATDTVINIEEITRHLCDQPALIAYYGEKKAIALNAFNIAKEGLDTTLADARNSVRLANIDGKRITVEEVNDRISLQEAVVDAKAALLKAEFAYEIITAAYYAIRERGSALGTLGHIYRAELNINDNLLEQKARSARSRI